MKKILSVVLCAIMLLACIPFAAFAEDAAPNSLSGNLNSTEFRFEDNTNYVVEAGATASIDSNSTFYLPKNSKLTVKEGAKLTVNGKIICFGTVLVEGTLIGSSNIIIDDAQSSGASAMARITFPALNSPEYSAWHYSVNGETLPKIKISYIVADGPDDTYDAHAKKTPADVVNVTEDGKTENVDIGKYLLIKVTFPENEAEPNKFDGTLVPVFCNGQIIPLDDGARSLCVTTAGDISYDTFKGDDTYLSTFKISLPTGEGYECIGRNNEISSDGTVYIKYGKPFSFRVELDEDYDMSDYKVYIYNGYGWIHVADENELEDLSFSEINAEPDEYGYYTIKKVKADTTVSVIGILANEKITLIGSIIETITNIFNMIKEFFASFLDLFKA